MMDQKFVIHISGLSCSGKSTLLAELATRFPGSYTVSYDKLKWQLAGYDRNKDGPLVKEIAKGLFDVICQKSLPILLDTFFDGEKEYDHVRETAHKYGYSFSSVKLTAPHEVLLQRFRKRVEDAKRRGTKISITDEKVFVAANFSRKYFVPENTPVFDTSKTDSKEIADKLLSRVLSVKSSH